MKVLQINATYNMGSTGKIMKEINDTLLDNGVESYMACAYTNDYNVPNLYCTNKGNYLVPLKKNILISRITGTMGYRYRNETKKFIEWMEIINPNIIHLHNIHGDWINIDMLFNYLKKSKKTIIWTLHDCWAFTGRCSHFELAKCEKWKKGCYNCKNKNVYPISYFLDMSKKMWIDKKQYFSNFENMIIVTPSQWLAKYTRESFLSKYPVYVINNGINVKKYKPISDKPLLYELIKDKYMILGVASSWSKFKGLYDFYKLDDMIDHKIYQIVLVGLTHEQLKKLPKTIIGMQRTNNEEELIKLYSYASVFVNPTYQDNFPTVNLEAISCGTPVITYNTGGSPESVLPLGLNSVLDKGDVEGIYQTILNFEKKKFNYKDILLDYSNKNFDKKLKNKEYMELYKKVLTTYKKEN